MNFGGLFQGVILAGGKGSRMTELTASNAKCRLPVGNKPLIWYPLNLLERLGCKDVTVIVRKSQKIEVSNTLKELQPKIKYECVIMTNDEQGTADSLRTISARLTKHVIVLPCDVILNIDFSKAFELYFKHRASLVTLIGNTFIVDSEKIPGQNAKFDEDHNVVFVGEDDRLQFHSCKSDLAGPRAQTDIGQLARYVQGTLLCENLDPHVYLMKNWIIKYLHQRPEITSIKGDLIPHIIEQQRAKPKPPPSDNDSLSNEDTREMSIFDFVDGGEEALTLIEMNNYGLDDHTNDLIRCYAYEYPVEEFGVRIDSLAKYLAITAKVTDLWNKMVCPNEKLVRIHPKAENQSRYVDEKSVIAEYCKISERAKIERSCLHHSTVIANDAVITNCAVMNEVLIEKSAKLDHCVVCSKVKIGEGATLKNCVVGKGYLVPVGAKHENETLVAPNRLMEVNADD